jgi:hypothetical protein
MVAWLFYGKKERQKYEHEINQKSNVIPLIVVNFSQPFMGIEWKGCED